MEVCACVASCEFPNLVVWFLLHHRIVTHLSETQKELNSVAKACTCWLQEYHIAAFGNESERIFQHSAPNDHAQRSRYGVDSLGAFPLKDQICVLPIQGNVFAVYQLVKPPKVNGVQVEIFRLTESRADR